MKKLPTAVMLNRPSPPKSGRLEIGDGTVKGLAIRVTARGTKSWSFACHRTKSDPSRPAGQHAITSHSVCYGKSVGPAGLPIVVSLKR